MYHKNIYTDNDSIDFDFFESEGGQIMVYSDEKQSDCSKIVTKAIIETNPLTSFDLTNNVKHPKVSLEEIKYDWNSEELGKHKKIDYFSSPCHSLENDMTNNNVLDQSLFNCLAFNDSYEKQSTNSFLLEDTESSNYSSTDSTITTITSDFTSVSPLSSISDSSCESNECENSSSPQNENGDDHVEEINSQTLTEEYLDAFETEQLFDSEGESQNEMDPSSDKDDNKIVSEKCSVLDNYAIEYESNCVKESDYNSLSGGESNVSRLEEELGDISLTSKSSSKSISLRGTSLCRGSSKLRMRKKEYNLTFNREELLKIERDNLILLRKIMAHSKPKSLPMNQTSSHKKTSSAINRARQQKKIEQDNYILFSKISAIGRMKKVF